MKDMHYTRANKKTHPMKRHLKQRSLTGKLLLTTAVFALFLMICISPSAAHTEFDHLNMTPWDSDNSLPSVAGSYYLTNDVIISETWNVPYGVTDLCLNGHMIIKTGVFGRVVYIGDENTVLNLYDCDTLTTHFFDKNANGCWVLNDTNLESDYFVTGGAITGGIGSLGSGVSVSKGVFNMHGGNIVGCVSNDYGGGVYVHSGEFNMYEGSIAGNTAVKDGAGVYVHGGNVEISNGKIVYNIADKNGGGVYVRSYGILEVLGGSISNNIAFKNGGGIDAEFYSSVTVSSGLISNNIAYDGGGICAENDCKLIMFGGDIVNNSASNIGGGVCASADFYLNGGNIKQNYASGGAGVAALNRLDMSGGCIANNTGSTGAGVMVLGNFIMSGDALVDDSNEVYLNGSCVIVVAGSEFTGGATNITCNPLLMIDGRKLVFIVADSPLHADDIEDKFGLQNPEKILVPSEDNGSLQIAPGITIPKINAAGLSLSTDISVRFYVSYLLLEDFEDPYVDIIFKDTEYKSIKPKNDAEGMRKVFTFRNISPAEMNEPVTVKLYATISGTNETMLCDTREYSVKRYCENMISKSEGKDRLTTLCVDLLNYGSASQVYIGETSIDKLANNTLTPEEKEWASPLPEIRNDTAIVGDPFGDSVAVWRAASLNLYSDISLICKFTTDEDVNNLTAVISYGKDGENIAYVHEFADSTYSADEIPCKLIKFNNLNALELNYPIEIALVNAEDAVSKTLVYSVDSYASSKSDVDDNLGILVKSIMKYIRAVEALYG